MLSCCAGGGREQVPGGKSRVGEDAVQSVAGRKCGTDISSWEGSGEEGVEQE